MANCNKQKTRRSKKKAGYYDRQFTVSDKNRIRKSIKRKSDLDFWIKRGIKKNGEKVLSMAEREARKVARATKRKQARDNFSASERPHNHQRIDHFRTGKGKVIKTEAEA